MAALHPEADLQVILNFCFWPRLCENAILKKLVGN